MLRIDDSGGWLARLAGGIYHAGGIDNAGGVFVSGTGTDVGKTFVSALLIKNLRERGLRCGYYKAALSGLVRKPDGTVESDAVFVARAAGLPAGSSLVSYEYEPPVSPHLAARLANAPPPCLERIMEDWRRIRAAHDFVVVEGVGGVICPLCYQDGALLLQEDVMRALALPLIIVSGSALGSINAAVLSASYLRQKNLPALGFILNRWRGGVMEEDNRAMIERLSGLPVLARVDDAAN